MSYPDPVWAHFRQPRLGGRLQAPDAVGQAGTPAAAAELRLELEVVDARIVQARFQAHGCPCAIAAGSWAADWLSGRALDEARSLTATLIAEHLQLPTVKRYCAVMAEDALRAALAQLDGIKQEAET